MKTVRASRDGEPSHHSGILVLQDMTVHHARVGRACQIGKAHKDFGHSACRNWHDILPTGALDLRPGAISRYDSELAAVDVHGMEHLVATFAIGQLSGWPRDQVRREMPMLPLVLSSDSPVSRSVADPHRCGVPRSCAADRADRRSRPDRGRGGSDPLRDRPDLERRCAVRGPETSSAQGHFEDVRRGGYDRAQHLKDMALDGVAGEVLVQTKGAEGQKFVDSSPEEAGFELSVPRPNQAQLSRSSAFREAARANVGHPSEVINHTETPDWDEKARELTDGRGVDCVVEIGGPGTIAKSLKAMAVGGHVSLIGAGLSPAGRCSIHHC